MPNYVAFLRGTKDAQAHLGPDEAQQVLERYLAWSARLTDAGVLQTGGALSASKGRVLRTVEGALRSTDGPHTEATEIVGGYIVITADDLDHAERVFSDHPHLAFGSIELRKVGENGCEP